MDLRLKAYLKATGIVLGCFGSVFLMVFVANGIMGIDFMRENYQAIQNALFKILLVCMLLMVIVYVIGGMAESDIRDKLQNLTPKEREKYEKQHKSDWQMRSVCILAIVMFVLAMMIALCGLVANIENPSNPSNQSVKTLDIEN